MIHAFSVGDTNLSYGVSSDRVYKRSKPRFDIRNIKILSHSFTGNKPQHIQYRATLHKNLSLHFLEQELFQKNQKPIPPR